LDVPTYFQRYLRAIQPMRASREAAIRLHKTLCERLAADAYFKDWYADSFLYGSYKRNRAIQPIKDVDVCVLLAITPTAHTPEAVVQRLRRVLERNGYKDKTALQRRSVRIDLSGTTLDVVPVVAQGTDDQPLWIPDRTLTRWVETHPKAHLSRTTTFNKDANNRYVPFVKIVKAWYRCQAHTLRGIERPKPKGFTLEALVAQYHDPDAPSYAEAFVTFLTNLWDACGADLTRGVFPFVPDFGRNGEQIALRMTATEARAFGAIVEASLTMARAAYATEGVAASAAAWREILGPKFPVQAATTVSAGKAVAKPESESDWEDYDEADVEVAQRPLPQSAPCSHRHRDACLALSTGRRPCRPRPTHPSP
jgi:Second Messenger Oligonucleotide or Dinucleotide Synthetase domain